MKISLPPAMCASVSSAGRSRAKLRPFGECGTNSQLVSNRDNKLEARFAFAARGIAALCLLLAGCSSDSPPTPDDMNQGSPEKPSWGKGIVNVDNGSPDEWELFVDGKKWCAIKPHLVAGFEVSTGNHEFQVMRGSQEVDRIKTGVKSGGVTVINPGGLSSYVFTTATYTTSPVPGSAPPPTSTDIKGERVSHAYYGLLQEMPGSIVIKDAVPKPKILRLFSRFQSKEEIRTKLSKPISEKPPTAEALAMLTGNPYVYLTVNSGSIDDLHTRAVQSLKSDMDQPEIRRVVLPFLESPIPGSVFEALGKYQSEIPAEQVVGWLTKKDVKTDNEGKDTPDLVRVRLAVQVLVQRGAGDEIEKHFSGLPESSRMGVLAALDKAPVPLRKAIILQCLPQKSPSFDSKIRSLINAQDFKLDEAFIQKIDAHIGGVAREDEQKSWEATWENKINRCAREFSREWSVGRLERTAKKSGGHGEFEAARALIDLGAEDKLVPIFAEKSADWQQSVLHALASKCRRDKQISDATLALSMEGLRKQGAAAREDQTRAVFKEAFDLLCQYAYDRPETRKKLTAVLKERRFQWTPPPNITNKEMRGSAERQARHEHEKQVEEMESQLSGAALSRIKNGSPWEYLALALDAPCESAVAEAIKRLFAHSDNKDGIAQVVVLSQQFPKVESADNRAWIIQAVGGFGFVRQYDDKTNPQFGPAFNLILHSALTDASGTVRLAAIKGRAGDTHFKPGPESEAMWQVIQSEKDATTRSEMRDAYNIWFVKHAGDLLNDPATRESGARKLIGIATTSGDEAAIAAMKYLRVANTRGMDALVCPALARVFDRAKTERCKMEAIFALGSDQGQHPEHESVLALLEKALADPSREVRHVANNEIYTRGLRKKDPKAVDLLAAAAAREPDKDEKRSMESHLRTLEKP